MTQVDIDLCYKTLMEAITIASEIVLKGFENVKNVYSKSQDLSDLVTETDKETEVFLIQSLSQVFPEHKFIGEETTKENKLTDAPTWIIDPIDGTVNYVHGFPHSGISVALSVNREMVIGVVCNPMLNQLFTAIKGRGSYLNGKRISASKLEDLKMAVVGLELSIRANQAERELHVKKYRSCVAQTLGIRCLGCAQLSLCMVASGAWDGFYMELLFPWDVAAGSLIIREAGGIIIDTNGDKFDIEKGRCLAAGNEILAKKLVNVFNDA